MPQSVHEKQQNVARLNAERAKRTPAEQVKVLDFRLGKGEGAKRERAKLAEQIERAKSGKQPEVTTPVVQETPEELKAKREQRKAEKKAQKRAAKDDE